MATKPSPRDGIKITRSEPVILHPVEKTCTDNEFYYLSNLDQNIAHVMKTVHCYQSSKKNSNNIAQVLREALEKVLVDFYPLDGSLAISSEGKLIIKCDGRGVPFVEAAADCRLEELGDNPVADTVKLGELVYTCPEAKNLLEMPLLAVQVTKFTCGGFVLGIAMNHSLADGTSASAFFRAWAETARGLHVTTRPFLDRSIQRARLPPVTEFPHHEFAEVEDVSNLSSLFSSQPLQYQSFPFDSDKINRLKRTATSEGSTGPCTSFEALTALIWRARTKALNMGPHQKTKLLFAVDVRNRVEPPLPTGFFGNGMVFACGLTQAGNLVDRPLSYAVGLVQGAVREITDRYVRSAIDYYEATRARPSLTATLLVTAWTRLGFNSLDFGWGEPVQTGPAELPQKEVAFFLPCEKGSKGVAVVMGLPASCMEAFQEQMEF